MREGGGYPSATMVLRGLLYYLNKLKGMMYHFPLTHIKIAVLLSGIIFKCERQWSVVRVKYVHTHISMHILLVRGFWPSDKNGGGETTRTP